MQIQWGLGYILATLGIVGMFASFVIQQSEFDPTSFSLSVMSIFIAITGIALILQPADDEQHPRKRRHTKPSQGA
jgi:1,4-dihydroxy-2-naphthoate octaprenyltransferase